jgi:hypothetical protein
MQHATFLKIPVATAFNNWSKSACQVPSSFHTLLSMEEAKCAVSN